MTNAYLTPHRAGKQYRIYCIDDRAADFLDALSLPACAVVRPADFETEAPLGRINLYPLCPLP